MAVEINTLYHVSVTVSGLLGLLLLYNWRLNRNVPALGWWGAGFLVVAVGLALVAGREVLHGLLSIVAGNVLLFLGTALWWTGARVFEGRRPLWPAIVAGPALWLLLCLLPFFYGGINTRLVIASSTFGIYTLLTAYELWRGHRVPLLTRWPAILLLAFHGGLFFVRVVLTLLAPLGDGLPGADSGWFALLHYEIILYEIALAFLMVAMAKERAGQRLVLA